jgi:D-3-phosphoglycerate dehydrogenase
MAYKIVIPQDITDAGKDFLKAQGYEVAVGSGSMDLDVLKSEVAQADAILARTAPFPAEVIDAAPSLKVIGRHGVGVDNIDVEYCTKKGVWVTYAPESNANSVAEHTLGMLFALARNMVVIDAQTRSGNWEIRNKEKGADLEGKTLGLIGLGRIGTMVAKKAALGADMKVIGFDALIAKDKYPAHVTPCACVEEVFEQADYVSLHVPSTPQTNGMVDYALISLMKKEACLINCARGEVVNEADLYKALSEGIIKGAALDVFRVEPASAGNPLFTLGNIIVTPHNAALTQESMDRMGLHAAQGIHAALSGQKPQWAVNEV